MKEYQFLIPLESGAWRTLTVNCINLYIILLYIITVSYILLIIYTPYSTI